MHLHNQYFTNEEIEAMRGWATCKAHGISPRAKFEFICNHHTIFTIGYGSLKRLV